MKKNGKSYIIGSVSGFANGLFGSGGGSIVVPCMEKFLGIPTHEAHATAIAVILPLSAVSMFFYLGKAELELWPVVLTCAGGSVGGFAGAKLLKKLSAAWIHKIFGLCMAVASIKMIFG